MLYPSPGSKLSHVYPYRFRFELAMRIARQ